MPESNKFPSLDPGSISRRRLLQTAGAGALTVGAGSILAACGSGGGSSTGAGATSAAKTIASGSKTGKLHNLVLLSNDWNTVMTDASKRAAAYLGLDYSESNFNLEESEALNQAQQAIAAGAEMLMTQAADGSSIPALGKLAQEHGVWMSNMETNAPWFSPIESGNHFMWFFCPADWIGFYETTKVMLDATSKASGGSFKVLHVSGFPGSPIDSIRSYAAKKALAEFPEAQLLGTLPGEWSAEGGQKATEALVSRYGNPDAIISQNDGQLTGVLAACRSLGLEPGKDVLLCGCDGTTDILEATAAGQVYSTNFASPAYFGVASVVRVFDGLNGFQPNPLERQLAFPGVVTTKDNAPGLLKRFVESDNLPFDPKLMSRTLSKDDWDPMVGFQVLDVDDYWKYAGVAKPSGYENPPVYTKSLQNGDLDRVNKELAEHNKIKLDDSSYKGVPA